MKDRIENLIQQTIKATITWIVERDGLVEFIDPIDHIEISAHYGATHEAVALIIYGNEKKNQVLVNYGERLLNSILNRWDRSKLLTDFHNDFNNFALCVLDEYTKRYHALIERTVLETQDSNHDTVNWLPMRWFVNKCRYDWTGEQKYLDKTLACADKIRKATYIDGFIDDRLPKGMSFNLQYDVATVAVMQFLRNHGVELDISKETGALLNAVAPDGDINYFGRGTNQVFAWGLWIYLLSSAGLDEALEKALSFCHDKILIMLNNNNIMLNEWDGTDKYLWWDYHFCSVYTAHLLLWLVLAKEDYHKNPITPVLFTILDSGIEIIRKNGWFIMTFTGRTEYLSERGPIIGAIGLENGRMIFKGSFGPWQGAFGKKYTYPVSVLQNYLGLFKTENEKTWSHNRFFRRIVQGRATKPYIIIRPLFNQFLINIEDRRLFIQWNAGGIRGHLNFPILSSVNNLKSQLFVDKKERCIIQTEKIKNQYDWIDVLHSHCTQGTLWQLVLTVGE